MHVEFEDGQKEFDCSLLFVTVTITVTLRGIALHCSK